MALDGTNLTVLDNLRLAVRAPRGVLATLLAFTSARRGRVEEILDLIGLTPTPEEVRAFLTEPGPTRVKRQRAVDRLMARPEFVDHWSLKWGDLLKSNRKFLGEKGLWRFRDWIRQSVAENKPYNQFVYELITARGSSYDNPAANYYLVADQPNTEMENTTQLFLGVRFVCARSTT